MEDTKLLQRVDVYKRQEFAEHDDSPDSAASLIRKLEKKGSGLNRKITGGI